MLLISNEKINKQDRMTEGKPIFVYDYFPILRNRGDNGDYFTKDGFCIPGAYGGCLGKAVLYLRCAEYAGGAGERDAAREFFLEETAPEDEAGDSGCKGDPA